MISSPFGALTQKRSVPVVTIEPLKVVPEDIVYCSSDDDVERVKAGAEVATAREASNDTTSKTDSVAEKINFVFFIPDLPQV
jgi:hypothetical protein